MQREEIFQYVKEQYGTEPEYLWKDNPDAAVLRHHPSNKWYAILMKVPGEKLGLDEKTLVDIIDVKADQAMIGMLIQTYGFLPGYHMNKRHWLTILLDGSVRDAQVLDFLDMSYDLIDSSK